MEIRVKQYDVEIEIKLDDDATMEATIDVLIGILRTLGWHQSTIDRYIIEMAENSPLYANKKSK